MRAGLVLAEDNGRVWGCGEHWVDVGVEDTGNGILQATLGERIWSDLWRYGLHDQICEGLAARRSSGVVGGGAGMRSRNAGSGGG